MVSERVRQRAFVDAAGIRVASGLVTALDVFFDGRRVCSVLPTRGELSPDGSHLVAWPRALRACLHGVANVMLREHASGVVVYAGAVRFDDRDERVSVVDESGMPAAVDKWGHLGRSFESGAGADAGALAEQLKQLLRDMNEAGVTAFVAYGTLLGAVRRGHVIGHDFDADVAYFSRHTHPADIALESFALQRLLIQRGWETRRARDSMFTVRIQSSSGAVRGVDVFVAYFFDGTFNLDRWVQGELRPDQIVPLSTVKLEGVALPAPADPESLLELTYGPTWRVPNPTFKFEADPTQARRITGWMTSHRVWWGRWDRWHRDAARAQSPGPSSFAEWVADRLEPETVVLDVGCGRGQDTMLFAQQCRRAVGLDFADQVIESARLAATASGSTAIFHPASVYDLRVALGHACALATEKGAKVLYARLTLDALAPRGRRNLWLMARTLLHGGGRAFLEFRDGPGRPPGALATAPWFERVNADLVRHEIAARGGVVEIDQTLPGDTTTTPRTAALRRLVAHW